MAAFDRPINLESHGIAVALLSPAEKFPNGRKCMQRVTKLLKRVWKALVWAELVVLAGWLLIIFSHYFSFDVFVSNLHRQATAAISVKPR
jgi:hypothetical protein